MLCIPRCIEGLERIAIRKNWRNACSASVCDFISSAAYLASLLIIHSISSGISAKWPLIGVIAFSWGIAFFEYCCQVPANRIGFTGNGGPFSLIQLKVIQECISLGVFAVIINILFQGQTLHWNHILAFLLIICAVYLVFMK